jgi:hypothetical protein
MVATQASIAFFSTAARTGQVRAGCSIRQKQKQAGQQSRWLSGAAGRVSKWAGRQAGWQLTAKVMLTDVLGVFDSHSARFQQGKPALHLQARRGVALMGAAVGGLSAVQLLQLLLYAGPT